MKDEEMAEEYEATKHYRYEDNDYCGDIEDGIKEAFLAGLKAGRPQWHDLQKDPTDLPKKKELILIKIVGCYILGWYDNKVWYKDGINENEIPQEYVIKWKEIE